MDRSYVMVRLRPSVTELLKTIERCTGVQIIFEHLRSTSDVIAENTVELAANRIIIRLRETSPGKGGWADCDLAHELMHAKMELLDGCDVLQPTEGVPDPNNVLQAVNLIRSYVDDEVVHANLAELGFSVDGEVIKPNLFDDVCVNVPRLLAEGAQNDGMTHLDGIGYGALRRASFLIQAELVVDRYGDALTPEHLQLAKNFIQAFRSSLPEQTERADCILESFGEHDVLSVEGHNKILSAWIRKENLQALVVQGRYGRGPDGGWCLLVRRAM